MPEAEAKDPMVELDVSGDSVDVELKEKEYSGSIKVAQADRLASFSVASSWTRKDKRWSFTF